LGCWGEVCKDGQLETNMQHLKIKLLCAVPKHFLPQHITFTQLQCIPATKRS